MASPPPPSSAKRSASPAEPGDPVAAARARARRRLVGAVVLLGIGVIAFPLVFETQPRPIPVDIPIEIPRKDGAPPLAMPAPRQAAAPASLPAPRDDVITETRADAGREIPGAASAPAAKSAARAASAPAVAADAGATRPAPSASAKPAASERAAAAGASAPGDGARAQALLEGKAPAAPAGARYVVQVGAFADAASVRDVRSKVEKLGLKTYTQVAETSSGSRTRVRVGPFDTRDEADRAQAKAKAAGIDAVVLTL